MKIKLSEMQKILDDKKYCDSAKAQRDMCGEYFFCHYCRKINKYPCASAYRLYEKKRKNLNKE